MGKKTLPDPSKKSQPFWGFVEMVTKNVEDVKEALKGGKVKKQYLFNVKKKIFVYFKEKKLYLF